MAAEVELDSRRATTENTGKSGETLDCATGGDIRTP